MVSALDSELLSPLLSDPETAALFSDAATVRDLLTFEAALARVQVRLGVIPEEAGRAIDAAVTNAALDYRILGHGSTQSGHPIAALVDELRTACGEDGAWVHRGATAQDVMDTALVLQLGRAFDSFETRIRNLIGSLMKITEAGRETLMAGRTRGLQAVPVTLGLKAAGWMLPLVRHHERLWDLRARVLVVQFGGAAGTLSVLDDRGVAVMQSLAAELGLGVPPAPWHAQRDGLAEAAGWFSLVTGSMAKFGADLVLLSQSEVAEVNDGSAGGSSAMPHKANPVRSETLVAIGRANASLLASMHHALVHEHERSAGAWALEWLTLPQMAVLAGAALRHGQDIAETLRMRPDRMQRNLDSEGGLVFAEAAMLALERSMSPSEANRRVKEASRKSRETGQDLEAVLARDGSAAVDWRSVRDPTNVVGSALEFVDRAVAAARKVAGPG